MPGDSDKATHIRAVGRALLTAEVLGFWQADESERRFASQGLEVALGFYDADALELVSAASELVQEELAYSVGGFIGGFQISLSILDRQEAWLGVGRPWPEHQPFQHLDLGVTVNPDPRDVLGSRGTSQILARRIRYRLGLDFKSQSQNLFWWSTAQTECWIARLMNQDPPELDRHSRREFNYKVGSWMNAMTGQGFSVDPLKMSSDDWGLVDLERDPIAVLCVGPHWAGAPTHNDVARTLARAGNQIRFDITRLPVPEGTEPLREYARLLRQLAVQSDSRGRDVVIVYRGGGLVDPERGGVVRPNAKIIDESSRLELIDAVQSLVDQGTEVVLGIGHGDAGVYEALNLEPPVGVHEAITPTAAAAWVLREHVNHRMIDNIVDPGQTS